MSTCIGLFRTFLCFYFEFCMLLNLPFWLLKKQFRISSVLQDGCLLFCASGGLFVILTPGCGMYPILSTGHLYDLCNCIRCHYHGKFLFYTYIFYAIHKASFYLTIK